MRRKHEGEAHSLDQALLVAEAALDAKEKAAAAEAAALAAASEEPAVVSEKPGKKSKLKKPRPSDERIALTRLRREKERELKAAHLDERTRLLDGLERTRARCARGGEDRSRHTALRIGSARARARFGAGASAITAGGGHGGGVVSGGLCFVPA